MRVEYVGLFQSFLVILCNFLILFLGCLMQLYELSADENSNIDKYYYKSSVLSLQIFDSIAIPNIFLSLFPRASKEMSWKDKNCFVLSVIVYHI